MDFGIAKISSTHSFGDVWDGSAVADFTGEKPGPKK